VNAKGRRETSGLSFESACRTGRTPTGIPGRRQRRVGRPSHAGRNRGREAACSALARCRPRFLGIEAGQQPRLEVERTMQVAAGVFGQQFAEAPRGSMPRCAQYQRYQREPAATCATSSRG
jgi:hypothetical protein